MRKKKKKSHIGNEYNECDMVAENMLLVPCLIAQLLLFLGHGSNTLRWYFNFTM